MNKLLTLAEYAEKNGAERVSTTAFEAAAVANPKSRQAQQGRLRIAYSARDTKRVQALLQEMLKVWPNDTAIQNDEAYIHLLLITGGTTSVSSQTPASNPPLSANSNLASPSEAEAVDAIVKLAEKMVRDEPASLPHRTLLALALMKQNRAQDALAVYANLKVPSNAVSASAVAVHASVLAATGSKDEARAEIAKVPSNRLLPEEAMMVLPLRG